MNCKQIKISKKRICIGNMDKQITISVRSIQAPSTGVDYDQDFSSEQTVWAAVQTVNGVEVFDSVNTVSIASHFFYIRYIANVTFENYLEYNNEKYRILETENIDQRNDYLLLKCAIRGSSSYDANLE